MDELVEQFIIEARELTAQAQLDLAALARNGADADIERLFRTIHTLKGSVAIVDMMAAERALHVGEDMLAQARSGKKPLSPADVEALIALIDQTERWVDTLERTGAVGPNLQSESNVVIARLRSLSNTEENPQIDDWLAALRFREEDVISAATADMTAFRYSPDTQCFFRGEDPISIVSRIPELEALSVLPVPVWPSITDIEPFECKLVIEGLSRASAADVREALRLVAEQTEVHALTALSSGQIESQVAIAGGPRSIRVDVERVDALADGIGELIVAKNALAHTAYLVSQADPKIGALVSEVHNRIDRAVAEMREAVITVRMVPLGPSLRRLPRIVREVSDSLKKPVSFEIIGDQIEVDKDIADQLFEPLLHIVRNSIDHGIEAAEDRRTAGKPEAGRLIVNVVRDGDQLIVSVSDDGAGINIAKVRDTAVTRGLLNREAADLLDDGQVMRLILVAGFSTSSGVTTLSGRGVGMDAVRSIAEHLGGRVEIASVAGQSTTISMRLPLNAIMTRLLVVRAGPERYGVPLERIIETASLPNDRILPIGTGWACVLRDRTLPVLSLHELLGIQNRPASSIRLLVTETGAEQVALIVDSFEERIDAVVRPRAGLLARLPGVSGTVLMGNGEILLVLDLPELVA